jgi:hypothetical protein
MERNPYVEENVVFVYTSGSQTVRRDTLVCREGPRGVSRN